MTRSGLAYALPTLALPTDETDGSASPPLLPTPAAAESTPTEEYVDEVRENLNDPHQRLYLPGRKWHAQRTLSRIAPALLPTPVVSDSRGLTDGDSREGGPSLREVESLLPTPSAWLGRRPENAMSDPERMRSKENEGERGRRSVELPDAIAENVRLLPTPDTGESISGHGRRGGKPGNGSQSGQDLERTVELLPTPTATYPGGTEEQFLERKGREPGGAVHLNHAVESLLPTPTSRDGKGPNPNERDGGDDLPTAVKLLPTPVVTDSFGSRRSTARTDEWTSNEGTTLTDAIWEVQGRETDTRGKLLPTPVAGDGEGGRTSKGKDRPDEAGLAGTVKMLPTPTAQEKNPGAGGELRAAVVHGETRRSTSDTDTLGRPIRKGRQLLPTPDASANRKSSRAMTSSGSGDGNGKRSGGGMSSPPGLEQIAELRQGIWPRDLPPYEDLPPETRAIVDSLGWSGESTNPPSGDGNDSSVEPLPGQLTILGDSTPDSPSGCSDSPTGGSRSTG
jgi:hypothetical protein